MNRLQRGKGTIFQVFVTVLAAFLSALSMLRGAGLGM